jgi:putative addiction module component (TIGR02574 family)
MTQATQAVLNQALALGPMERAELIDALFRSFDRRQADRVDALWAEEAEARADAFESGAMGADTADEVFGRIGGP